MLFFARGDRLGLLERRVGERDVVQLWPLDEMDVMLFKVWVGVRPEVKMEGSGNDLAE